VDSKEIRKAEVHRFTEGGVGGSISPKSGDVRRSQVCGNRELKGKKRECPLKVASGEKLFVDKERKTAKKGLRGIAQRTPRRGRISGVAARKEKKTLRGKRNSQESMVVTGLSFQACQARRKSEGVSAEYDELTFKE